MTSKKNLLFFRRFHKPTGGHLKLWHYFEHAEASTEYTPSVYFTADSVLDASNPWVACGATIHRHWQPAAADAIVLGGLDWKWLKRSECPSFIPVLNVVQSLRHAAAGDPRREFLSEKAIRVCVNPLIESALREVPELNGPLFTMPMGLDVLELESEQEPTSELLIAAYKAPELGRAVHSRLNQLGISATLLEHYLSRREYLQRIASARTVLCLPSQLEGFYLPALEAMAFGKLVVCPDCVANRLYLEDGRNGFLPEYTIEAILTATQIALALPAARLNDMVAAARATAASYTMARERAAFLELLKRTEKLWHADHERAC